MLVLPEVIDRAQRSDAAAFNQIVLAYRKSVQRTIARMIARPEDAEDIAQEVFTKLYFSFDQLRAPKAFELWLHRITVNTVYTYLRRRRGSRESRISDLPERQVVRIDAAAGRKVDRDDRYNTTVRETVDELLSVIPESDRILLMLKEVDELSISDLEKVYLIAGNALKVRLFRARQRVLKALKANEASEKLADRLVTGFAHVRLAASHTKMQENESQTCRLR
jgi:RNA polymerase sigma-70 factor (ECF subfamily)